ncbi:MAG TPA: class I SAM-dependent methyltransferase [Candidatus Angelobacter sp.]|jgi:cyclopropane fatty-acyl-phospholipid synthase-like methyltransferase|nr:class I SAM-dependent methyltransferase [Candidatus Angelobacter sp.]
MGIVESIRPILDRPFFYELFHTIVGAHDRSNLLVREYIRPQESDRILDVGCGPGNMLPYLPEAQYLGVDANESYIESARKRYGHRGKFICDRVSHQSVRDLGEFDIVLALGLVHHLADAEARDLFRMAYTALRPGGRLVTTDGCYTTDQSAAARYLLSRDRGQFIRTQSEYRKLAGAWFSEVRADLRHDTLRIPYTLLVMVCTR